MKDGFGYNIAKGKKGLNNDIATLVSTHVFFFFFTDSVLKQDYQTIYCLLLSTDDNEEKSKQVKAQNA